MAKTKEIAEKKEAVEPNTEDDLPQKILEKYSSDQQVQLIKGYRILQVLMYYLSNSPFFDKPENDKFGTKYYYDVIKNPMWFNEIKRKFFNAEYISLLDVIKDMRLIFENCYYFWGPKTSMTEQCLRMERLMEKQLLLLPKDLKNSCSLEETHGKNEDETVTRIWNRHRNKGKSCSNLMVRAWRKRRIAENEEYKEKSDLSKFTDSHLEIIKWEKDILFLADNFSSICSVVQLPQIGQFFYLVQDILKLEPLCQIEVERMFLIPQYSSAFRKILSTLLINVQSEEIPSYQELMSKLRETISEWYSVYEEKNQEDVEASRTIGIEPEFFRIVGESNPFIAEKYEELPYRKKIVILKSLCDHFVSKNFDVQEIIANADEKLFSPEIMGPDKFGYSYLVFSTFLDFRLYKQKIREDDVSKEYLTDNDKTTLKRFFSRGSTSFEMVADSIEGIRCVIDDLICADMETKKDTKSSNSEVIEALRDLETSVSADEHTYIRLTNEVRIKLFNEWKEIYSNENPEYFMSVEEGENIFGNHFLDDINSSVGEENENDAVFGEDENCDADAKIKARESELEKMEDETAVKIEIKEEALDDSTSSENSSGTRRRRSSVPSYSVFNKDLLYFSDNDAESPDEIYSEGDDSDDDWKAPSKRSKLKGCSGTGKNKLSKQLKQNAKSELLEERKRKKNIRKCVAKSEEEKTDVIGRGASVAEEEENCDEICTEAIMESNGVVIKEEIDDIDNDIMVPKERRAEDKGKPTSKIKVVDLAKLQKSETETTTSSPAESLPFTLNPNSLQSGMIISSVPMKDVAASQDMNSFPYARPITLIKRPQMINTAYTLARAQTMPCLVQRLSEGSGNSNFVSQAPQRLNISGINRIPAPGTRFVNATAASNSKIMFIDPHSPNKVPQSMCSKQFANQSPLNRGNNRFTSNLGGSFKAGVNTGNLTNKLGRSITIIPKMVAIDPKERGLLLREIEGTIGIHSNNGTLQYVVNLANGTHVPLSNEQVQKLRNGNNGALPIKLKIPVPADVAEKIEPCVIIDD